MTTDAAPHPSSTTYPGSSIFPGTSDALPTIIVIFEPPANELQVHITNEPTEIEFLSETPAPIVIPANELPPIVVMFSETSLPGLPDPASGGTTTYIRPIYIFDD